MEKPRTNDLHKLDVYRCALELYKLIGAIIARFPHGEADLRSQMKRASRSVPHNIGEGVGKRHRQMEDSTHQDLDLVVAATLTLLGLIIGFSFSMATNRYDQRKLYEKAEANAIGTEYVRADILPAADAASMR